MHPLLRTVPDSYSMYVPSLDRLNPACVPHRLYKLMGCHLSSPLLFLLRFTEFSAGEWSRRASEEYDAPLHPRRGTVPFVPLLCAWRVRTQDTV
jgi:hypothetical protein